MSFQGTQCLSTADAVIFQMGIKSGNAEGTWSSRRPEQYYVYMSQVVHVSDFIPSRFRFRNLQCTAAPMCPIQAFTTLQWATDVTLTFPVPTATL